MISVELNETLLRCVLRDSLNALELVLSGPIKGIDYRDSVDGDTMDANPYLIEARDMVKDLASIMASTPVSCREGAIETDQESWLWAVGVALSYSNFIRDSIQCKTRFGLADLESRNVELITPHKALVSSYPSVVKLAQEKPFDINTL